LSRTCWWFHEHLWPLSTSASFALLKAPGATAGLSSSEDVASGGGSSGSDVLVLLSDALVEPRYVARTAYQEFRRSDTNGKASAVTALLDNLAKVRGDKRLGFNHG